MLNKYVLTGGPRTGKTTLLRYFSKIGYKTVQEAATLLIREHIENKTEPPWRNPKQFQQNIFETQVKLESKIKNTEIAFADRGTIDTIAYAKYYNIKPPQQALDRVKKNKYKAVFLLDFVGYYQVDSVRIETFNEAEKIQKILKNTYLEFGYDIICVPPVGILQRAQFVLSHIQEIESIKNKPASLQP